MKIKKVIKQIVSYGLIPLAMINITLSSIDKNLQISVNQHSFSVLDISEKRKIIANKVLKKLDKRKDKKSHTLNNDLIYKILNENLIYSIKGHICLSVFGNVVCWCGIISFCIVFFLFWKFCKSKFYKKQEEQMYKLIETEEKEEEQEKKNKLNIFFKNTVTNVTINNPLVYILIEVILFITIMNGVLLGYKYGISPYDFFLNMIQYPLITYIIPIFGALVFFFFTMPLKREEKVEETNDLNKTFVLDVSTNTDIQKKTTPKKQKEDLIQEKPLDIFHMITMIISIITLGLIGVIKLLNLFSILIYKSEIQIINTLIKESVNNISFFYNFRPIKFIYVYIMTALSFISILVAICAIPKLIYIYRQRNLKNKQKGVINISSDCNSIIVTQEKKTVKYKTVPDQFNFSFDDSKEHKKEKNIKEIKEIDTLNLSPGKKTKSINYNYPVNDSNSGSDNLIF